VLEEITETCASGATEVAAAEAKRGDADHKDGALTRTRFGQGAWSQHVSFPVRIPPPGVPTWDMNQLNFMLGRSVNQATSFRFLHSYLYEPWPATGQYWLSDNV